MSGRDEAVNGEAGGMAAERFAVLLDAYGANPSRWPEAERAAAETYAAAHAASHPLAAAAALDAVLDRLVAEPTGASFHARVLATFDAVAAERKRGPSAMLRALFDIIWPGAPLWQPASAFAVSLAAGIVLGVLVPYTMSAHDSDPSANILAETPVFDLDHGS